MVSVDRIIAVMMPEAAQTRRIVARAKNEGKFLDATHGRRTRSVVVFDSGHVVVSGYTPLTISERISRNEVVAIKERDEKDDEEVHGREYFFISVEKFQTWIAEEKFLEYAEVFGNFYGTPSQVIEEKRNAGIDVLLEIDVQGALKVMKKCPDGVYIFLLPPSIEELCNRITNRGTEPPEVVRQRIQAAQKEFATGEKYQYVVVNDSIDAAVEKIKSILTAERCRTENNLNLFDYWKNILFFSYEILYNKADLSFNYYVISIHFSLAITRIP